MAAITSQWWRRLVNAYEMKAGMACLQCKICVIHTGAALQRWASYNGSLIAIQIYIPYLFLWDAAKTEHKYRLPNLTAVVAGHFPSPCFPLLSVPLRLFPATKQPLKPPRRSESAVSTVSVTGIVRTLLSAVWKLLRLLHKHPQVDVHMNCSPLHPPPRLPAGNRHEILIQEFNE